MEKTILIPGLLGDASFWQPTIQLFGADYDCTVFDTARNLTIEQLADALWVEVKNDPILIGFSFGAWIALQACLMQPNRCKALVLISSAPGYLKDSTRERFLAYIKQISSGGFETFLQDDFDHDIAPANKKDQKLKSALLDMMRKQGPEMAIRQFNSMLQFKGDFINLKKVQCPALLIRGAFDNSVNRSRQTEICEDIQAELKIIDNSAHYIPLENPEEMANVIQEWFDHS